MDPFEKAVGRSFARDGAHALRRGWYALASFVLIGATACGDEVSRVPLTGSIVVATETSGFLKDDGYELLVDGESKGAIGANDEVTLAELAPASYQIALGDVATNCSVESTSVDVVSEETASVMLSVVCAPTEAAAYSIQFNRERPDLDAGVVEVCPFGICSSNDAWDLYVYNNTSSDPHAVIRQNQTISVQIAHLTGTSLGELTEEAVAGATFTTELVADAFDASRVILIRTNVGSVYALGNPVEDALAQTLDFDAVYLLANPE